MPTAPLTLRNSRNLVRLGVGDLDAKLLLDGHDDLDGVERVEAEVRGECGGCGELWTGSAGTRCVRYADRSGGVKFTDDIEETDVDNIEGA
jgi:hypothetical protein